MNNIHSNTTFLNEAIDKKTDVEDEKTDLILANMIDLRKTMSDVLSLLLGAKKNSVIDQALFRILQFFDVDRVYIGTFDEQTHTVDFTNEVTCDGIISRGFTASTPARRDSLVVRQYQKGHGYRYS